jgi:autoinducer 2-binding protein LuxP
MKAFAARIFLFNMLLLQIIPALQSAYASEYLTIDTYHQRHPEQAAIGKDFSKLVRGTGIPIEDGIQTRPVTIVFIYPGEQVSDYWYRSVASFKARMDEIGLQYKIKEFFTKPAVDYRTQEAHLRDTLKMNPDYLVFTLDIQRHRRLIQHIITKRAPKLILQNITTPLAAWEGKQPFLYVGFDHARGTAMLADYYIQKTRGKGKYALLYFSQGYVSAMRGDTFIARLQGHPGLELVSSYYTDGNRDKARQAAREILNQTPDIHFIYACSTDVAMGAIDAVQEMGAPVMVNGWGGGSSELSAIMEGQMEVTVMRINDDNGVAMAEAIRLDIEGKAHQVPQIYSGDFALVDQKMDKTRLDSLKERSFRYSGQAPK